MHIWRYSIWITLVVLALSAPTPQAWADFMLVPGNVYGVIQGGIGEWDSKLNPVASLLLPGVTVTEGVAFTANGDLVFSAFLAGSDHLLEVDPSGAVVHNLNLGLGFLDRASDIAIDRTGRIYVAASSAGIIEVAADFSSYQELPYQFSRASGVAVGPDNRLYVTDQASDQLVIFGDDRQVDKVIPIGSVPTGLDFNAQGQLYIATFFDGTVERVDPNTGLRTVVLSGLPGVSDIAFLQDGSYYLATQRGQVLQLRSEDGALLVAVPTGNFTDSIDVFATTPEPSSLTLLGIGSLSLLGYGWRRRKQAAA